LQLIQNLSSININSKEYLKKRDNVAVITKRQICSFSFDRSRLHYIALTAYFNLRKMQYLRLIVTSTITGFEGAHSALLLQAATTVP
jgi:hypothetical protein